MAVEPLWPMKTIKNVFARPVPRMHAGGSRLYVFRRSLVGRTKRPSLGTSTAAVVVEVVVVVVVGGCVVVVVVLVVVLAVVVLVVVLVVVVAAVVVGGKVGGCGELASLLTVSVVSGAGATLRSASGWTATLTAVGGTPGGSLPI